MAKIPLALQLYSVREDCAKDLPGTLAAVAKMGYAGVEFAGYHGRSAKELRKMLDDLGLKAAGTHLGLDTLEGDKLAGTIEFNQAIGNRFLIVPWIPEERRKDRAGWLACAQLFNELAAKVAAQGMLVGYHNHHVEFTPLGGETPWDTFFGNTRKDVVMQLDTGNCLHGNGDPVAILRKFPARATTLHLKEFSKTNDKALIGEGDVAWAEVFRLSESAGATQWYIVEQESYAFAPLECARRCIENLRKMGK